MTINRRALALIALFPSTARAQAPEDAQRSFMARAVEMRRRALANDDQGFGAVLVANNRIIGESPSRVVTDRDPTAHAEMSAIRDAGKRGERLVGATLYSTSIPCSMCQAAAAWVGVSRMIFGDALTDAGPPRAGS